MSGLCVASQRLRASKQFLIRDDLLRHHLEVDDSLVADFSRPQVLGDKIEGWILVPRDREALFHRQWFKPILEQLDLPCPVIGETRRNGSHANPLIVDKRDRSGRIRPQRHPPADTSTRHQAYHANDKEHLKSVRGFHDMRRAR